MIADSQPGLGIARCLGPVSFGGMVSRRSKIAETRTPAEPGLVQIPAAPHPLRVHGRSCDIRGMNKPIAVSRARAAEMIGRESGTLRAWSSQTPPRGSRSIKMTSEQPIAVTARGQTVDEWKLFPGRENHLFDCCVMGTVAAGSSQGTAKARADAEVGIGSSDFLERLGKVA